MAIIEELKTAFPSSFACVVEDCTVLKATELARRLQAPTGISAWQVDFEIGEASFTQEMILTTSPLPCGDGHRFYLICDCQQRCHKMYLPPKQDYFACRKCHRLYYKAQKFKRYL